MRKTIWLGLISLILFSFGAFANSSFTQRKDVQKFINMMVKNHQFNRNELIRELDKVQLQPQIIESMEKPYEKKTWDVYSALFLTPQRLQGGLKFWSENEAALEKARKRFGVPPEIIVAILGVETLYGERQGDYSVLDALATLAFNYPKRSVFFTKELKEYFLLCREQGISPVQYKGSYAGAIGMPQFMPSSYRYYAIDFSNKGVRDLVSNNHDAIGSIANYFHKHGWRADQGVAQFATVSGRKYKTIRTNPRVANYQVSQLAAAGVKPVTASQYQPSRAGLIELVTNKGNEYWLAYPNFFVITRYNSSPQYALVVYLLSQQLKQQRRDYVERKHRSYA